MPKVLVISAHRLNRSPSQRYRYEQYLSYLSEHGFEFTFSPLLDEKNDKLFYSKGRVFSKAKIISKTMSIRKKDLKRLNDFDLVFIQREASFLGNSDFEKAAFKSKAKIIFDFDDSIWLADTSPGNKKFEWLKNPAKTKVNIAHAHLVIAGNDYLAAYALNYNKNVIVIPTTVETKMFFPKPELRNKETLVIGWSGSISTVKHFEILLPVFKKLKEKYGNKISFTITGDGNYHHKELNIKGLDWNPLTEVDDLNHFDIGVMPLPNNEWSKGKCALKGLTYMACGVPTVMSAVGVNAEIIKHGENGLLASNENEWFNALCSLIENENLRKTLGQKGKETVERSYSTEANKEKYLWAFNSLLG